MSGARPRRAGRGLLANSIALLATSNLTAVLGYLFWVVCARGVSPSTIGMMSTATSAMGLAAILAAGGFEPYLARVLPGATSEERSGLCGTALVLTAVLSGVAGVVGALLLPGRVQAAVGTGWLVGLVGAGAVGTALLLVINAALLGVRRAELSLVGSVVGSMSRIVAVVAVLTLGVVAAGADVSAAHTVLMIWVGSLLISFGLSAYLFVRAAPGFRFRCGRIWFSRLRGSVAWDYVATLAGKSPPFAIPILASALFPPAQVGYMFMAAMISGAFFAVAASVSYSLLAQCADDPERLRTQSRRAAKIIGALLIPPLVITCLLAPKILGMFGANYAQYSALLVLLLLTAIPDALINVVVAILRVQRRLVAVATVTVMGATITIGGSWLLMPHLGINGAGWAALATPVILAAMLAVMWHYRSLVDARTARTAVDSSVVVDDGPPPVVAFAPSTDVSLLSPVGAIPPPADDPPPKNTHPSARS
jgi:O-antigen/teichoic acid export membrane protein